MADTSEITVRSPTGEIQSPILDSDNEMMTSFCNPNYQLNDADELNSNSITPSEFYDDNHIYEDPDLITTDSTTTSKTTSSSKRRKKYAETNLTQMGIDSGGVEHNGLNSPDGMNSVGTGSQHSLNSEVLSPMEKTTSIVEVEHTESDSGTEMTSEAGEYKAKAGFMGYYASLELSTKDHCKDNTDDESEGEDEEEEEEDEEEEEEAEKSEEEVEETEEVQVKKPLLQPPPTAAELLAQQTYSDKMKVINSPDSNDSGIQADVQHVRGPVNEDLYAVVEKKRGNKPQQQGEEESKPEDTTESGEKLPPGWERHEDEGGAYYWHIKSGTIQRQPPTANDTKENRKSLVLEGTELVTVPEPEVPAAPAAPAPPSKDHLQEFEGHAFKYATESLKSLSEDTTGASDKKTRSKAAGSEAADADNPIRFAVRSLGWVRIAEEDLTPARSSKAVNKCIVDLSLGRNDINDVVGRWGDGKDLYMDLDNENLTLIDPQDATVLNVQPIQSIRVWGVGRDNGRERDFAYVARDRATRKHMCHVFRCDTPARQIANTLRDICKRIMMERSMQQSMAANTAGVGKIAISRPTNLPNLEKATEAHGHKITFQSLYKSKLNRDTNTSFPTPMEEPKKVLRCHYLGTAQVPSASGPCSVEVLNGAMETVFATVPPEKWVFVNIAVAPSTITISEYGADNVLAECRVRFLSFMGIAMRNVKLCSFIVHTAPKHFVAHVFHCEPSAGAICKTIEAACKLRYQKCLDAHPTTPDSKQQLQQQQCKAQGQGQGQGQGQSLTAALKAGVHKGVQGVFNMLKKKPTESKPAESKPAESKPAESKPAEQQQS